MARYRVVVITFVCLALTGCARHLPTPTPDLPATEVALSSIVQATMTALAPTTTPTLRPTVTPAPPPTMPPVDVPAGWREYQSITEMFTLCYPPTWTVEDESSNNVAFDVPNFAGFMVGMYKDHCGIGGLADHDDKLNCLAAQVAETTRLSEHFRLVNKGAWSDEFYRGYVVESVTYSTIYESNTCEVRVFIPLAGGMELFALYFRVGTTSITDQERELLSTAIGSFRSGVKAQWLLPAVPFDAVAGA